MSGFFILWTGRIRSMLNSIPEILDDLKKGLMVIVVDDEDREMRAIW